MSFKLSFFCVCVCVCVYVFSVQIFHKSQEPGRYFILKMGSNMLGSFIRAI